jgi:DNA-directed RNA polymerase subunit RPC12/RpoP
MTEIEKAYCAWYVKQNPSDDPGWCLTNQNALEAFEAGAHAAMDFNRPIIKALEERVATLEARAAKAVYQACLECRKPLEWAFEEANERCSECQYKRTEESSAVTPDE